MPLPRGAIRGEVARPSPDREPMRHLPTIVLTLATCLTVSAPAGAQTAGGPGELGGASDFPVDPLALARPSLRAERVEEPVVIDGRLDEAAWASADSTTETWVQILPEPGMPASERTVVRVLYDHENLYVGAVLYDADPTALIVPGLEQDYDTPSSDMFAVALDTYHDRQNGFVFAINPAGAVWDAQVFNDQADIVPAWEGIVDVRTGVDDVSWRVEMAIPFATLRFAPSEEEQVWGINFTRRIRRRNEDAMWAPVPRQYRVYRFSLAGTLEGLRSLPRGRNLWLKPYALADRIGGAAGPSTTGDVGLDVKWGLTPRMTLDLTANTDFSQVEVDAEQVNLTRFNLFFPEKRDFFLENEGTFAFQDVSIRNFRTGSSSRSFRLFHSRRIGLSDTREPLPVLGGARLTGRIGERLEVGFLEMQTRAVEDTLPAAGVPAENFAVARVKAHLSRGSHVGAMLTNRQETGGAGPAEYNRALGVDGGLTLARNLVLNAYLARTYERAPAASGSDAGMVQAAWRSDVLDASVLAKSVDGGFDPGLGFVDRTGTRRLFTTVGAHPQVGWGPVLQLNPYVDLDWFTTSAGVLETRAVTPGLGVQLRDGGSLSLEYTDRLERLFAPTSIAGSMVAAGTYRWGEPSVRYTIPGSYRVSGSVRLTGGDFYDGRRASVSANLLFRPNEHFSMSAGAQHNDLELGGRDFTADVFSTRIRYARDTRTFLLAFLQYNEATEELIANARFNLIHAPLSDVFVVYTERRSLADGVAEPVLERGLTLKVTKLLAF